MIQEIEERIKYLQSLVRDNIYVGHPDRKEIEKQIVLLIEISDAMTLY